jgi:hypothetical protein
MKKLYYGCFDGVCGQEIAMTLEQAQSASHQGRCDEDVAALLRVPEIAAQFDTMDADRIRDGLAEYGAWDSEELSDDHENRLRALWLAAGDIADNREAMAERDAAWEAGEQP